MFRVDDPIRFLDELGDPTRSPIRSPYREAALLARYIFGTALCFIFILAGWIAWAA